MCQHVISDKDNVMPIQRLRRLLPTEVNSPFEQEKRTEFNTYIRKHFGDLYKSPDEPVKLPKEYDRESYCEEDSSIPEADDFSDYAAYINAEVILPQNWEHIRAVGV